MKAFLRHNNSRRRPYGTGIRRASTSLLTASAIGCALLAAGCGDRDEPEREPEVETSGPINPQPGPQEIEPTKPGESDYADELRYQVDGKGRTAVTGAKTTGDVPTGEADSTAPRVPMVDPEAWKSMSKETAVRYEDSEGLEQRIRDHLMESDQVELTEIDLTRIEIDVEADRVVLTGTAPSEQAVQAISRVVREVPRVGSVDNQLRTPAATE